jgi:hypothetical protein
MVVAGHREAPTRAFDIVGRFKTSPILCLSILFATIIANLFVLKCGRHVVGQRWCRLKGTEENAAPTTNYRKAKRNTGNLCTIQGEEKANPCGFETTERLLDDNIPTYARKDPLENLIPCRRRERER